MTTKNIITIYEDRYRLIQKQVLGSGYMVNFCNKIENTIVFEFSSETWEKIVKGIKIGKMLRRREK